MWAFDRQLFESGPADAEHTVLLLPGGMCSARSYLELTQEPTLSGLRLVAATMPGQAGAPSPDDYSPEAYGRTAADLVAETGADVVVGFSMGAGSMVKTSRCPQSGRPSLPRTSAGTPRGTCASRFSNT